MEQKKKEFLANTSMLFMRYGVKSLTMDDIARHLSVSKKTIYKHVSDKKELVKQCMECAITEDECLFTSISSNENANAIDILLEMNKQIGEKLQNLQPAVMYDIQKYFPESWKILEDHKKKYVFGLIEENINRGIKEGLYRENLVAPIVAGIYITMIDKIFDSEFFPPTKYDFQTLHREIARYHIRGIANEKGRTYLKEKLKADIDNN